MRSLLLPISFGASGAVGTYLVVALLVPEVPNTAYMNVVGLAAVLFAGIGRLYSLWRDRKRPDWKD